ncbi:MAG TPA: PKD domain-containing protein, partial [Paludibaculum sp.]
WVGTSLRLVLVCTSNSTRAARPCSSDPHLPGLYTSHWCSQIVLDSSGSIQSFDPAYEDDFWSKPGFEGTNPPSYLTAAKVDGYATVAGLTRNAQNTPIAVTFEPGTVPALGSIGAAGLQFYVYGADGKTRITNGQALSLAGKLEGNTLTLAATNDATLLNALATGGKIRINNRFLLAACFYPRHSILDNGNPAYNQYKNADGTTKYVQRPIQVSYLSNIRTAGGRRETGHLTVKTIVIEDLVDPASYPYVASFYAGQVSTALGAQANDLFRIYYNENSGHGSFAGASGGKVATSMIGIAGIMNQALLDLAAWAERGIAPPPSSRHNLDAMNQVILPEKARERHGLQPVVHLTADGKIRAEVGLNQPVNLSGTIEMPPGTGKVIQYDWYLGKGDFSYEPATKLAEPQPLVTATRSVSFARPGEYTITLRAYAQRDGVGDATSTTLLQNLARIRVVVR